MAGAKKFGTFGGVFTPSILTILGVIMYLRLGYVVGEAGLYAVLAIIVISHIISVSTGLSLSSIATDKKIKTGGVYYMLSRSLGLAMGGSIGITLFLGTALSIALYIVGFVENFLSIEAIGQFLNMDGSATDIRIIGTIVIILLVIIAYISTSIAIKTQYFILGAIALSLISIVLGLFLSNDFEAASPALTASGNSPDLIILFAIFFPAVTGFTAGVAMSGDLKSPKDAIPKGTLMSILVGFIVYVSLAILFAYFVDRNLLLSDTNFLQKIAWFSPFVIAGIWGATLSSALGGILGAPRIFQAMSIDKVTPTFFAKGMGKSNEPRRALILTFLLAEMGILIGELDAIARLVSMFYIAAYGFINLAYVLERWSNSDFRPSLKISIWVGIVGFAASIFVMMNLDALGMLAALVLMFGIYLFLKRKEVHGSMNDVWQSVWTSIIRTSLNRINKKPLTETNWQPNIILFSGGTNARSHLIDFGLSIAGKQGFLSNFDLVLSKDSEHLFSKPKQKIESEIQDQYTGVFTRRQAVGDLYDGIEMISRNYGFSGVEPNTVMLGWARQTKDPKRFSKMVRRLTQLDMNVVLLDYDKRVGWGKKQSIDIWWRGGGHNGNLALTLAKFIVLDDEWADASIRLLIVNQKNDLSVSIFDDAKSVLESLRIEAEVMIINNEIENRSFYDIIQLESVNTDLTFLGFSPLEKGAEEDFVNKTNKLCENIGTVAIIKASSQFKNLKLGKNYEKISVMDAVKIDDLSRKSISYALENLKVEELRTELNSLTKEIENKANLLVDNLLAKAYIEDLNWLEQLKLAGEKSFDNLINRSTNNPISSFSKLIDAQHKIFMRGQLQYANENWKKNKQETFDAFIEDLKSSNKIFEKIFSKLPYRIKRELEKENISNADLINRRMRIKARLFNLLFAAFKKINYYIHFKEIAQMYFPQNIYAAFAYSVKQSAYKQLKFDNEVFRTLQHISGVFYNTVELFSKSFPSVEELETKKKRISEWVDELIENRKKEYNYTVLEFKATIEAELKTFINILNHPLANSNIDYDLDYVKELKNKRKYFAKSLMLWRDQQENLENLNELNIRLLSFRQSMEINSRNIAKRMHAKVDDTLLKPVKELKDILTVSLSRSGQDQLDFLNNRMDDLSVHIDAKIQQNFIDIQNNYIKKAKTDINNFPNTLEILIESVQNIDQKSDNQQFKTIEIAVRRTLAYMFEKDMQEVRDFLLDAGQEFNSLNTKIAEIKQNISIPVSEQKNENKAKDSKEEIGLVFHEQLELYLDKIKSLQLEIEEKKEFLNGFILKKSSSLRSNLELYSFTRNVEILKNYIRTESTTKWLDRFEVTRKKAALLITNQLNKLWYNQSSGFLLAQMLSKSMLNNETRVHTLLKLKDEVSPNQSILKRTPDYYQQLFLRKHFYLNEFWIGRKEELNEFSNAYKNWKRGYAGGILILGERNSGKSFFSNYAIEKLITGSDIYFINPPFAGSVKAGDLLDSFRNSTEIKGGFSKIMQQLSPNSVFVLDDIELWWEKSTRGMQVINEITRLIDKYSHLHLFVVLSNIHSFRLINKYQKIESFFLNLIELRPFNAKQLKDILMTRHHSSSMKLSIRSIPETRYGSWNFARLFNRYFNYSEGNPGVALQAWIKSIDEVSLDSVNINKPKVPDSSVLKYLETDWMIFILHFILHKRMNFDKLKRVSQESKDLVGHKLNVLKRAGVLIESGGDVYDINPYLLPLLRKALAKRELL